ncbi:MAG TPA: hypothetical protein VKU77_33790 [Streptosporangiaceae bacterium]|nr:hypothetical protein [Streptosporangiaceae bacterium]
MPEFTYTGLVPREYPESRHSDGTPVRSVQPGDIRDLDGPLDGDWREAADADRAVQAAETPKAGRPRKAAAGPPETAGPAGPAAPEG